jgi:hypothetical protein
MPANQKYSVGKILVDGVPIGVATNITIRHDGNPQEFRGGDHRYPLVITPGDQSLTVTADTANFDATEPDFTTVVSIELQTGANGGGLAVTLTNMVLVAAEVSSSQNSFIASSLEWRKQDVEL